MFPCPHCDKTYSSYKSRSNHVVKSHPTEKRSAQAFQSKYNDNPEHCQQCNSVLRYEQRHATYCSHGCAAVFNNKLRSEEHTATVTNTWRSKLGILNRDIPSSINQSCTCTTCGATFSTPRKRKYCSSACNQNASSKQMYRKACSFNIDLTKHPDLANVELLQQHGWYRPANHPNGYNPEGATWDHLYRVSDGFANNVPPEVMSHPANAEMLSWEENTRRRKSMITLEELHERIALYEARRSCAPAHSPK